MGQTLSSETLGFHVLRVQEGGPGHLAGLEAYFDFILELDGSRLENESQLKTVLTRNVDKTVSCQVYSSKTDAVRSLFITPSASWGGQGLLGVSIRLCSFEKARENVWHVLEVSPNSPAELAGLKAFSDYIVGSDSILLDQEDLFSLIETDRPVKLFVYNFVTDLTREVVVTPMTGWGGEGLLGCGLGYGYLHRIPSRPLDTTTNQTQEVPQQPMSVVQTPQQPMSVVQTPPPPPLPPQTTSTEPPQPVIPLIPVTEVTRYPMITSSVSVEGLPPLMVSVNTNALYQ